MFENIRPTIHLSTTYHSLLLCEYLKRNLIKASATSWRKLFSIYKIAESANILDRNAVVAYNMKVTAI